MSASTLVRILHVDAAANAFGGLVLLAAGGMLAEPAGLSAGWPLRLAGLGLVVYGIENLLVSRDPGRTGLAALAVVDLAFALGLLAVAATNPTAAEAPARWSLVVLADLSAVFGVAKILARRSMSSASA